MPERSRPAPPTPSAIASAERVAALLAYGPVEGPADGGLDALVALAAQICAAPVSLVTLVDDAKQVFRANVGFSGTPEAPLEAGFCPLVVEAGTPIIIPDTHLDAAHRGNPAVTENGVRFYAGVPLVTEAQHVLGTLCVLDGQPRPDGLRPEQLQALQTLAGQVMTQFELRRALVRSEAGIRERDALADTQAAIGAAGGDLDVILDSLVAGVMLAIPAAEGGALELLSGNELEYRAAHGSLRPHRGICVPLTGSTSGECFRTDTAILVDDAHHDPRAKQDFVQLMDVRAALYAPVRRGSQVLGVLKLQASRVGAFTAHDLQLARLFAGAASAGLTEAREAAAQEQIRLSESHYQAIFHSAIDYAIIVLDRDGNVTNWNSGAEKILGWSFAEMTGKPADVFFTPEDRAAAIPATEMLNALTEGRGTDERWHLRKSGERFWANGEMMVLRDLREQAIGFIKILRDRTEQRQSYELLQASEERNRLAQEAGGVGLFTVRIADSVMLPSPEFCRLYGLPVQDSYPATAFEGLVIPEDAHLVSTAATRGRGEPPRDVEYRIRRADTGVVRWIARKGEVVHDEAGQPVRFSGVSRDITEQRSTREALAASEERLSLAFAATDTVGWYDWDVVSDRMRGSATLARIFGVEPALAEDGAPIAAFMQGIHPDDRARMGAELSAAMTGGEAFDTEYRLLDAAGEVTWVHSLGRIIYDGQGRPVRFPGVITDITAVKRAGARQAALFELSERLRDGDSTQDIALTGAVVVGRVLHAGRVGYGTVSADGATFNVEHDWTAPGFPSLAGHHRMSEYGAYADDLRQGETVTIADVRQDTRTAPTAETLEGVAVRALINLPIVERGRLVAVLYVNDSRPRQWSADEIAFARQVAELVRQAVERRRAEEQQRLLNTELSHRLKNTLAMVQAIATQTLRNTPDPNVAREALASRLIALGKAHDLLMTGAGESAGMAEVIAGALKLHDDQIAGRFTLGGPPVVCGAKSALALALMIHELATNAAKYGALSVSSGTVVVTWQSAGPVADEILTLTWQERGGPPVAAPSRKGFGSRLIERGLAGAVGGEVQMTYAPSGVRCTLTAPRQGFEA